MHIKKWFCRNYISIIALIVLILNSLLYAFSLYEKEIFIGIIASIATLYLGIIKYKIDSDKFSLDLFESFNKRYDDKLNDVFNRIPDEKQLQNSKQFSNEDRCAIIDYINLCAEEYYWYKNNRIPENVWKAWRKGISENLKKDGVRQIYASEIKNFEGSFYGLEKEFPPCF